MTPRRARRAARWGRGLLGGLLASVAACGGGGGGTPIPPLLTPGTVDFELDAAALVASVRLEDRWFTAEHCAVEEGLVAAPGLRRLVRFDTVIANMGEVAVVLGDPTAPAAPFTAADFEFSPCHEHHHFSGYADYELRDATGAAAGFGHKQAFCILDSVRVLESSVSLGFDCEFQGLSPGWADTYDSILDGQWVDVTGLPEGDYVLVVAVNPDGRFVESPDLRPNVATVSVHLPDPSASLP